MAFVLAVVGAAAGWQFGQYRLQNPQPETGQYAAQTLPGTAWDNLDGGQNALTEWQGKVLIVNHWATWCSPCRREIPMFMQFRAQYADQGLELIGIAHDDRQSVQRYVDSMGMEYPQLLAGLGQGQKWLAQLGSNGSLPLTAIFDRDGHLRARKIGLMSEQELRRAVEPLL